MTGTEPFAWVTEAMVQLADPDELVVPLQVCTVLPDPKVRTSVFPARGVPLVVSVADSVAGWPLTAVVAPV